jgi:hypothetical protein
MVSGTGEYPPGQSVDGIRQVAEQLIRLDAELEAAGEAQLSDDAVAQARAILHVWVDSVVGVVSSPGVGRVSLIHANGRQSAITSPELPFLLSRPVDNRR